jgi:hypothetical protein
MLRRQCLPVEDESGSKGKLHLPSSGKNDGGGRKAVQARRGNCCFGGIRCEVAGAARMANAVASGQPA